MIVASKHLICQDLILALHNNAKQISLLLQLVAPEAGFGWAAKTTGTGLSHRHKG